MTIGGYNKGLQRPGAKELEIPLIEHDDGYYNIEVFGLKVESMLIYRSKTESST